MRKLIFKILRYSFLPIILRELVQRKHTTILVFHNPDLITVKTSFEYLSKNYKIISLRKYIELINNKIPIPSKSIIITFDDGYKENYKLLDIIKKFQIPITIFVCSDLIGTNRHFWWTHPYGLYKNSYLKKLSNKERLSIIAKYDNSNQEDLLDKGRQSLNLKEFDEMVDCGLVDFQSHTMSHPILNSCDNEEAFNEINDSKKKLERDYNLDIFAIAYPNGNYSKREVEIIKNTGYKCALTAKPGINKIHTNVFELKRLGIRNNSNKDEIIVRASGLWGILLSFKSLLKWD